MPRRAVLMLLLGFWNSLAAAETIERLETAYRDGRYTVDSDVILEAPRARVWNLMNDFEQLPRLSPAIVEARVLGRDPDRVRLRLRYRGCVLFFCKTTVRTADVHARPETEMRVTGDPAASDWRDSRERWELRSEGTRTRLRYHAEWEPDFFVPPLIGPVLVKYFLEREIRTTSQRVEELAAHE